MTASTIEIAFLRVVEIVRRATARVRAARA
jgi:hypothetical protein